MNRFWNDLMLLHGHRVESRQSLPWGESADAPPASPQPQPDTQPLLLQLRRWNLRLCGGIGDGVLRTQ